LPVADSDHNRVNFPSPSGNYSDGLLGLRDLIEAAALLRGLPRIVPIAASVAEIQPMHMELPAPVCAARPMVGVLVRNTVVHVHPAAEALPTS